MPTHINQFREHSNPKLATAREALARLSKGWRNRPPSIKVSGENIELVPRKERELLYDYSWIPQESEVGATIDLKTFGFENSRRSASNMMLKRRGYVCIGKSVYEYRGKEK